MIYIVTGLPRSGTTLMMRMLEVAGIEPYFNPIADPMEFGRNGSQVITNFKRRVLYETAKIRHLQQDGDDAWVKDCMGKSIKNVVFTEAVLPKEFKYKFIYMDRNLKEVSRSQNKFNRIIKKSKPKQLTALQQKNAEAKNGTLDMIKSYPTYDFISVRFEKLLKNPKAVASRIVEFLGVGDATKMAECVVKRSPKCWPDLLEEKIYPRGM